MSADYLDLGPCCAAAFTRIGSSPVVGARTKRTEGGRATRRSTRLFDQLTYDADLSEYRARIDEAYADADSPLFRQMYDQLADAGFDLVDFDDARAATIELRRRYDAQLEYLIDMLLAPRGFWGHAVGHRIDGAPLPDPETPDT